MSWAISEETKELRESIEQRKAQVALDTSDNCKFCERHVIWTRTLRGAKLPVDFDTLERMPNEFVLVNHTSPFLEITPAVPRHECKRELPKSDHLNLPGLEILTELVKAHEDNQGRAMCHHRIGPFDECPKCLFILETLGTCPRCKREDMEISYKGICHLCRMSLP